MDEISANTSIRPGPSVPYMAISNLRDKNNTPIVILRGVALPTKINVNEIEQVLRPLTSENFVLVYTNARAEASALSSVLAFRRAYETLPLSLRQRIVKIVAVHVSFVLRAHIYAASTWMQCNEYGKLVYCDLLADLEKELGADSLLLGLTTMDFTYDEEMRFWVGRQHEHHPVKSLDPKKALLNLEDVHVADSDPSSTSPPAAAPMEP